MVKDGTTVDTTCHAKPINPVEQILIEIIPLIDALCIAFRERP
jgi:hypothetical protein